MIRRIAAALAMFAFAGVVCSAPAAAHGSSTIDASNFESRLKSNVVFPEGIQLRVLDYGDQISLRNNTQDELVVLGYEGEPYLRVGPNGVFANTNSPAYFLNSDRFGNAAVPETAKSTAAPEWKSISQSTETKWHDHRTHWMSPETPAFLRNDSAKSHTLIDEWKVPMTYRDSEIVATGMLRWLSPPSKNIWLSVVIGIALISAAILWFGRRSRWSAVALLGCLVAVDIVHSVGVVAALDGSLATRFSNGAEFLTPCFIAWSIGAFGIWRLAIRSHEGVWYGLFASLFIALNGGLTDLETLNYALLSSELPPIVNRVAVAACIGIGVVSAVGYVIRIRNDFVNHKEIEVAA